MLAMRRQTAINSLLRLDRPLAELRAALATLDWDWDHAPAGTLTRPHVVAVLHHFECAQLDDAAVEEWANLIECREDIGYEAGYEAVLKSVIFDLANPTLQGHLADIAPRLRNLLGVPSASRQSVHKS
jgi:hypothetical protein